MSVLDYGWRYCEVCGGVIPMKRGLPRDHFPCGACAEQAMKEHSLTVIAHCHGLLDWDGSQPLMVVARLENPFPVRTMRVQC